MRRTELTLDVATKGWKGISPIGWEVKRRQGNEDSGAKYLNLIFSYLFTGVG